MVVEKLTGINHTLFIATIVEGGLLFILLMVIFVVAYRRFSCINYSGEQQRLVQ